MSAAVLFRGHAWRPPHDPHTCRPWGVDWRKCLVSQYRHLLYPLKQEYGEVHTYLCFYTTQYDADVEASYLPVNSVLAESGAEQKDTFLRGLGQIDGGVHDLVVTCRFDLELKSCVLDHDGYAPDKVNFLWREWNEESWLGHRRVPDAMHFVPGRYFDDFRRGVEDTRPRTCLHFVYPQVVDRVGEHAVNLVVKDGFINSNSDHDTNPFYKMVRVTA